MADGGSSGVLLALDVGTVRIGVAACDADRILAFPVGTIAADREPVDEVKDLVAQYNPVALIIGLPLTLDGEESFAAGNVRAFAEQVMGRVEVPVWLVDERMTTAQASKRLHEAGKNSRKARGVIDASAAVGILESVLEALKNGQWIGQRV